MWPFEFELWHPKPYPLPPAPYTRGRVGRNPERFRGCKMYTTPCTLHLYTRATPYTLHLKPGLHLYTSSPLHLHTTPYTSTTYTLHLYIKMKVGHSPRAVVGLQDVLDDNAVAVRGSQVEGGAVLLVCQPRLFHGLGLMEHPHTHTPHSTPHIQHPTPCTEYATYTLHPARYTLQATRYTLHRIWWRQPGGGGCGAARPSAAPESVCVRVCAGGQHPTLYTLHPILYTV